MDSNYKHAQPHRRGPYASMCDVFIDHYEHSLCHGLRMLRPKRKRDEGYCARQITHDRLPERQLRGLTKTILGRQKIFPHLDLWYWF